MLRILYDDFDQKVKNIHDYKKKRVLEMSFISVCQAVMSSFRVV